MARRWLAAGLCLCGTGAWAQTSDEKGVAALRDNGCLARMSSLEEVLEGAGLNDEEAEAAIFGLIERGDARIEAGDGDQSLTLSEALCAGGAVRDQPTGAVRGPDPLERIAATQELLAVWAASACRLALDGAGGSGVGPAEAGAVLDRLNTAGVAAAGFLARSPDGRAAHLLPPVCDVAGRAVPKEVFAQTFKAMAVAGCTLPPIDAWLELGPEDALAWGLAMLASGAVRYEGDVPVGAPEVCAPAPVPELAAGLRGTLIEGIHASPTADYSLHFAEPHGSWSRLAPQDAGFLEVIGGFRAMAAAGELQIRPDWTMVTLAPGLCRF